MADADISSNTFSFPGSNAVISPGILTAYFGSEDVSILASSSKTLSDESVIRAGSELSNNRSSKKGSTQSNQDSFAKWTIAIPKAVMRDKISSTTNGMDQNEMSVDISDKGKVEKTSLEFKASDLKTHVINLLYEEIIRYFELIKLSKHIYIRMAIN